MLNYYFVLNIFLYSFYALAMEQLDITWETPADHILRALKNMGRQDLEEYWKENNFVVDPAIENLFCCSKNDCSLSFDTSLLEKAKRHPKLRVAAQKDLRQAGQTNALGLFAGEAIEKNQPIIEYVGQTKVIFAAVADEPKLIAWLPTHLSGEDAGRSHYNFGFEERYISNELRHKAKTLASTPYDLVAISVCIDPAKRGNVARFANYSDKWANAELVIVSENIDGKIYLHPLLVALRDIDENEEILWDYGKNDGYIEIKGKELNPEYKRRVHAWFLSAMTFPTIETSSRRYQDLHAAPYFHDNLTSEEAKKLLIEPASYLLRQENGQLFFCANGQDFRLDDNYEPVNRSEYVEIEFYVVDGRFTFDPQSDPSRYGNHFDRLYQLRKAAKFVLFHDHLMIHRKKALRRLAL